MNEFGLTHIYCGDGKGKTTAAMGLAVRAAASGARVLVVQFLKSGLSAELNVLKRIENITVYEGCHIKGFTYNMTEPERAECLEKQNKVLSDIMKLAEEYDLLVLDEIFGAISSETLCEENMLSYIKSKPTGLELVMTGREPSKEFIDVADYVTEMKKIKHPFDKSINARVGIEY